MPKLCLSRSVALSEPIPSAKLVPCPRPCPPQDVAFRTLATLAAATLLLAGPGASAQSAPVRNSGPYVGAAVGLVSYDPEAGSLDSTSGFGGTVLAGYDFGRFFALEGEVTFGDVDVEETFRATDTFFDGTVGEVEIRQAESPGAAIALAVRGRVPVGTHAEAFARLGLATIDTEFTSETRRPGDATTAARDSFSRE